MKRDWTRQIGRAFEAWVERTERKRQEAALLRAFETQYPGVQARLRELRRDIEAAPREVEPLLERARFYFESRLPSSHHNCAADCTRALELDPNCADAYLLRAQCHPAEKPAMKALDYLSAWALDRSDEASRRQFVRLAREVWRDKTPSEKEQEIAALRDLLESRVGETRAHSTLDAVEGEL